MRRATRIIIVAAALLPAAPALAQPRSEEAPQPRVAGEDPRLRKEWWGEPVEFGKAAWLRAVSPDGRRAVVGDRIGLVCVDLQNPKVIWYLPLKDHILPRSAAFSPDGKLLATAEADHGANLYDAETGTPIELFAVRGEPGERPYQVEFLPDGKLVVLASQTFHTPDKDKPAPPAGAWLPHNTYSYSLIVWDTATKKVVRRTREVLNVGDSSASGQLLGSGHIFAHTRTWYEKSRPTKCLARFIDPLTGKSTPEIELERNEGRLLGLTPDGKTLLAMVPGKAPRLVDVATGKTTRSFEGHIRPVTAAAFSPDGKLVATVSGGYPDRFSELFPNGMLPDGPAEVYLWNAATGERIARYQFPSSNGFNTAQFSPDGNYLVVATGWAGGDRTLAFGRLPFPRPKKGESVGVPLIPAPAVAKPPQPAPLPPTPAVVPPPAGGGLIADSLDKLAEELPKSNRPAAQQIDALFLAALGRLPTAAEVKKIADTYKTRLTADVLRKIIAEIVESPEFEAHVKTLAKRLEAKSAAPKWMGGPFPGPFPGTFPALPGGPTKP